MISTTGSRVFGMVGQTFTKRILSKANTPQSYNRHFSFSFAGPRTLNEIVKLDMLKDKSVAEVSDIWMTYHESKENVHGMVLTGKEGKSVISRATKW